MWESDFKRTIPKPEIMPKSSFITISNDISKTSKTVPLHILQALPELGAISSLTTKKTTISQVFFPQQITAYIIFSTLNLENPFG
jgi:hypothetical protein